MLQVADLNKSKSRWKTGTIQTILSIFFWKNESNTSGLPEMAGSLNSNNFDCRFRKQVPKACPTKKSIDLEAKKTMWIQVFYCLNTQKGPPCPSPCPGVNWDLRLNEGDLQVCKTFPAFLWEYSRVPGSRNHGFWPSQRVSKHTLMKSETQPASVVSINH